MFVVVPGVVERWRARRLGSASTLTVADAEAIRRDAPSIAQVSYIRQQGGCSSATRTGRRASGGDRELSADTNWRIGSGRGISDDDVSSAALVAVLGQTVYHQRRRRNAISAVVTVKGFRCA